MDDQARPAVSPVGTEGLREQVAEAIYRGEFGQAAVREPFSSLHDVDKAEFLTTADAVMDVPWIKYAAGQKTVVRAHEQNNAALARTNAEFAEENASLRAESDKVFAALVRLVPNGWHATPTVWQLLDAVAGNIEGGQASTAEVERLETLVLEKSQAADDWRNAAIAERDGALARAQASLPAIPDDAAEQIAAMLRETGAVDVHDDTMPLFDPSKQNDPLDVLSGVDKWVPVDVIARHIEDGVRQWWLSAPATDPAPATPDGHRDVQWGVRRNDGVLDQMDGEEDAREHLTWFDGGTAEVVSRTVAYGPWTTTPASPQAPVEPKTQCAWWWDTKQCTDWAAQGKRYCAGHQRDFDDLAQTVGVDEARAAMEPAAREDTAPPTPTEHDVEVSHQDDGWATAECRTCEADIGESTKDTVEDWVDRHRADTLQPGRLAPIPPATED